MQRLFFIGLCLLIFSSCKKSKENIVPDHVTAAITVNGNDLTIDATGNNAFIQRDTVPLFGAVYISISGFGTNNEITVNLPNNTTPGTYNIMATGDYVGKYQDLITNTVYYSSDAAGSITIENFSGNYIKGNFHLKCYDTASEEADISSGTFEGTL